MPGKAGIAFDGACLLSHCFVLQASGDCLGRWELLRESGFAECHYRIQPKGTFVWVVKPVTVIRIEIYFRCNSKHLEAR